MPEQEASCCACLNNCKCFDTSGAGMFKSIPFMSRHTSTFSLVVSTTVVTNEIQFPEHSSPRGCQTSELQGTRIGVWIGHISALFMSLVFIYNTGHSLRISFSSDKCPSVLKSVRTCPDIFHNTFSDCFFFF